MPELQFQRFKIEVWGSLTSAPHGSNVNSSLLAWKREKNAVKLRVLDEVLVWFFIYIYNEKWIAMMQYRDTGFVLKIRLPPNYMHCFK